MYNVKEPKEDWGKGEEAQPDYYKYVSLLDTPHSTLQILQL
jgi:hypothetical protein